ncbi:hypothetical protein ABEB36_004684 [Hypothenemus hampei]|uniref:Uncharacterized protein n=1 Tax=Hypothenemus hampei TaxID=57062 RepID=A0ABD1F786_HYPHA
MARICEVERRLEENISNTQSPLLSPEFRSPTCPEPQLTTLPEPSTSNYFPSQIPNLSPKTLKLNSQQRTISGLRSKINRIQMKKN